METTFNEKLYEALIELREMFRNGKLNAEQFSFRYDSAIVEHSR